MHMMRIQRPAQQPRRSVAGGQNRLCSGLRGVRCKGGGVGRKGERGEGARARLAGDGGTTGRYWDTVRVAQEPTCCVISLGDWRA